VWKKAGPKVGSAWKYQFAIHRRPHFDAFDLAVENADDPRNPMPPVEEHASDDGEGAR